MRIALPSSLIALFAVAPAALAQTAASPERGVYLTAFRSPATGIELRAGHTGGFVGFYPTVIARGGARDNANFVRAGATFYLKPRGAGPYVSPSLVWSLGRRWRNGALTEAGFRGGLYRRLNGRLGVAVLTTLDGPARVNPTVGLDIRLGGGR